MGLSLSHLLVVLLIVVLVFGTGRISRILGEVGRGIHSLREGLKGEDDNKKIDEK